MSIDTESRLIKRDELIVRPALYDQARPEQWTQVYVMDRLVEAFKVIARDPGSTRPRGFANCMPRYAPSDDDLRGRSEKFGFAAPGVWVLKGWDDIEAELERARWARNRDRSKPSPTEVTRMHEAMSWQSLIADDRAGSRREIRLAVGLCALWESMKVDIGKRCRARRISAKTILRRRDLGTRIMTQELIRLKRPVT